MNTSLTLFYAVNIADYFTFKLYYSAFLESLYICPSHCIFHRINLSCSVTLSMAKTVTFLHSFFFPSQHHFGRIFPLTFSSFLTLQNLKMPLYNDVFQMYYLLCIFYIPSVSCSHNLLSVETTCVQSVYNMYNVPYMYSVPFV